MDEQIDTLLVDVRASTEGFRADIDTMRSTLDRGLIEGFERAGSVLERGLLSAIRRGSLGFDELKRVAFSTLAEIAAQTINSGIGNLFGASGQSSSATAGIGNMLTSFVGSLLGAPGRATGGPVSPGRAFMVGERGPEVFVPTSAGRIETGAFAGGPSRDVRVSISLAAPRGTDVPMALRRSSRQVASQVRRALQSS